MYCHRDFHLIWTMLQHYLVKFKNIKQPLNFYQKKCIRFTWNLAKLKVRRMYAAQHQHSPRMGKKQNLAPPSTRIVSEIRLNRMEFIACKLISVSLPEFITESGHVMIQITGRIFYCRYRTTECHFGHVIRLLITSSTNVTRNPAKKNCFASVHQCCIVFEKLNVSRFSLHVLNSKETRQSLRIWPNSSPFLLQGI